MKKLALIAIGAIALASCTTNNYKRENVQLANEADSVNYAFGYNQGTFINDNILKDELNTPKAKKAFSASFNERFGMDEEKVKDFNFEFEAQAFGYQLAKDLKQGFFSGDSTLILNKETVIKNLMDAIDGNVTIAPEEADAAFRNYMTMEKHQRSAAELDSMNMLLGVLNGIGIKNYLEQLTDIDDPFNRFKKNLNKGLKIKQNDIEEARMQGTMVATQFETMLGFYPGVGGIDNIETNKDFIKAGILDCINEYNKLFTPETADSYFQAKQATAHETQLNEKYGSWKTENEEFLAQNKEQKGIITTESGLQYRVIKMGKGAIPQANDRVKVHYEGKTIENTIFDSSYERKEPTEFGINQVIPGWTEGLQLMPVGSTFEFFIPQELAYGEQGAGGNIEPYSTLIFKVELLDIVTPKE